MFLKINETLQPKGYAYVTQVAGIPLWSFRQHSDENANVAKKTKVSEVQALSESSDDKQLDFETPKKILL